MKIAVIFELNEDWIGGSYYFRNLIAAFNFLREDEQPDIVLLSNQRESVDFMLQCGYPKLEWVELSEFERAPEQYPFDVIFPHPVANQSYRTVCWIPDFQELHLPYYFSQGEVANRRHHHRLRFKTAGLVVSSEDAKADVERFYPGECQNVEVVRFAAFDRFDPERLPEVRAQYGLPGHYVMCANQVWIHKNHIVVLRALALLKERGIDVTVCFTGSEKDYRVGGYIDLLKSRAAEWGLSENVRFLGFIPRADQLTLMYGADYVVQPSLFEGWSTVIEDAKSMGQFVVASDLAVHYEQLLENGRHFPRHDPKALADIMAEFAAEPPRKTSGADYDEARRSFARDFLKACRRFLPARDYPEVIPAAETPPHADPTIEHPGVAVEDHVEAASPADDAAVEVKEGAGPHDFSFVYYRAGEYSQVSVVRMVPRGQATLLLQRKAGAFSVEFKVHSFSNKDEFSQKYLENNDTDYRIYFNFDSQDMMGRLDGLPGEARQMLRDVAYQDPGIILIQNEGSERGALKLFMRCTELTKQLFEV
ncbi:glycosyltransferase family 4 protein [Zavarzinia compransoris]|uniref:Glycosyl transferase family 1 domain-containing protein n=1 Tax=Zavarzinia compransoris TaxID=1264899 RepID=A0A317DZA0_9PROT|nr:glycosyltransferase family 1 protein [Zavarzinia compransoris]PWR18215.1 hypothetical protein DKG75_19790 [Zavarzinia compransoris]TDP40893.1 glycosyl transferase family 1 [Zavarzinia compransoris]